MRSALKPPVSLIPPVVNFIEAEVSPIFILFSKLNFTSNLINRDDREDAIVFYSEQKFSRKPIFWFRNFHFTTQKTIRKPTGILRNLFDILILYNPLACLTPD